MKNARLLTKLTILAAIMITLVVLNWPAESLPSTASAAQSNDGAVIPQIYLPIIFNPCARGDQTFSDDFSDPESGWTSWDVDVSQAGYLNGEYRLLIKLKESHTGLARGDAGIGTGYRLAADVRNATGRPGQYGLLFGFEGGFDPDFYTFQISPEGNYYVYYNEQHIPDPIQSDLLSTGWSASIRTGTTPNNLAVIHRPSTFYFYANDQFLTTLPSDRTGAEQLGMFATSGTAENLDVRFDNFEVHSFNCDPISNEQPDSRQLSVAAGYRDFVWPVETE